MSFYIPIALVVAFCLMAIGLGVNDLRARKRITPAIILVAALALLLGYGIGNGPPLFALLLGVICVGAGLIGIVTRVARRR